MSREYKVLINSFVYLTDFAYESGSYKKDYFKTLDSETQFLTHRMEFENVLNIKPKKLTKLFFENIDFKQLGFRDFKIDIRAAYAEACAGNEIDSELFLKFPKFCVLYSKNILKSRFLVAEKVIASDPVAAYLYAKHVIDGPLPEEMHNQLLIESFVGGDSYALKKYLAEFG